MFFVSLETPDSSVRSGEDSGRSYSTPPPGRKERERIPTGTETSVSHVPKDRKAKGTRKCTRSFI